MTQEQNKWRIRSFVRRTGRMTKSQRQAIADSHGWLLTDTDRIDGKHLFHDQRPLVLDIGFGNGDALAEQALAFPDHGFIGIEVHTPGVGHLLQLCQKRGIENIRIVENDIIDVLQTQLVNESLQRVQIFFPDPWHKKRHHKRRLIQASFLDQLIPKLHENGQLHIATDWEPYADHCLEVLGERDDLQGGQVTQPEWRFASKFEQLAISSSICLGP